MEAEANDTARVLIHDQQHPMTSQDPARAHVQGASAGNQAINRPEVWGPLPAAIENQQLMPEEQRFGDDGPCAARAT